MALARGRRTDRRIDYWPGFVDALSTLLLTFMFLLSVFVLAQFLLSREITGDVEHWANDDFAAFVARVESVADAALGTASRGVFDAAFVNLDQWVRKGTAPPHAPFIELKNAGASDASVVLDEYGHGKGGVRSPYVDVPVATYFTNTNGPGTCAELGHKTAFDASRFTSLYGTPAKYAAKIAQSVDALVRQHWLTASDGKKIKVEAAAYHP